jgi:carboxyl-terminal processing protease
MGFLSKISKFGMPLVIALSIVLGMMIQKRITPIVHQTNSMYGGGQSKIDLVLSKIQRDYVDTVNYNEITEAAIPKILEELDPHSVYIPAKDFEDMNAPLQGNFDGIGVQFSIQKDTVAVVKVITGGPSEKVGIMDGDRIITVNDSLIAGVGITNDKIMKLLRGHKGTKVNVGIKRNGEDELVPFTITRGEIPLNSVEVSYMIDDATGFIKLTKFSRTTYKEFQQAIAKLRSQGMKKLIFDLRSNTGGYMDAAINIVDEFLPAGKLIVYTEGRNRTRQSYYSTARNACGDIELVILLDSWSASASEIVSGAIQDNDRGKIIGRRSFGKALVQEPVMFSDGSSMRLTTARYYIPSGRSIQKPYDKGFDKYFHDIEQRFINGEFSEQDSTSLPDSLKYYTTGGRIVYGGGGIMPDMFVPLDTSGTSNYLTRVSRRGLEYQYCFEYTDKNREVLTGFKNVKELENHLNKQDLLNDFIKFAAKNGVKRDAVGIKLSGEVIEVQLKAYIARNILDNDGFYPMIRKIDLMVNTAYKTVNK